MTRAYTHPVTQLLTYGGIDNNRRHEPWPDYLELGFTTEHIADLIEMATDDDLHNSRQQSLEVWAPLHAWRALAQLGAVNAAQPLVLLFEKLKYDDWLPSELPAVFSMIGPSTIPILEAFLGDDRVEEICRISVPRCLERMAQDHTGHRDACVGALLQQLERFGTNGPVLNAFLISSLIDVGATEAISVIRQAFAANEVDLHVAGDVEDVEIEMGIRISRSTPPPRLNPFDPWLDAPGSVDDEDSDSIFRSSPVRRAVKVGRNDPCPCGSGKKFKKCCLT